MNNLRDIRKSKLLSQNDLAKKLDLKQSTIAMWENSKSIPPYKTMQKLADALEVDLQVIVNCFVKNEKE